jgi:cell division protein FtsW
VIPFFIIYLVQEGYQKTRIVEFLDSIKGKKLVWQTQQSLIALGNGGPLGLGLGGSKQKYHFLPDPFTDFIFAIVGEELGIIGTFAVLILFMVLIWRGCKIAQNAPDAQGMLLAAGIVLNVAVYAFTNAGVVVNLLPTTGIPMPFLSYGGSALIVNLFAIGVLLNISVQVWRKQHLFPVDNFNYRGKHYGKYGSARKY